MPDIPLALYNGPCWHIEGQKESYEGEEKEGEKGGYGPNDGPFRQLLTVQTVAARQDSCLLPRHFQIVKTIEYYQVRCRQLRQLQTVKKSVDSCRLPRQLKTVVRYFRHVCSCLVN